MLLVLSFEAVDVMGHILSNGKFYKCINISIALLFCLILFFFFMLYVGFFVPKINEAYLQVNFPKTGHEHRIRQRKAYTPFNSNQLLEVEDRIMTCGQFAF